MQFHPSDGFKFAIRILDVSHAESRFASGLLQEALWGELRVLAVQTEGPEFKSLTLREHTELVWVLL